MDDDIQQLLNLRLKMILNRRRFTSNICNWNFAAFEIELSPDVVAPTMFKPCS
jgi:hypothetical protein